MAWKPATNKMTFDHGLCPRAEDIAAFYARFDDPGPIELSRLPICGPNRLTQAEMDAIMAEEAPELLPEDDDGEREPWR